jgi:hypothetical protein
MEPVVVRGKAVAGKSVLANPWNGVTYRLYDLAIPSNSWKGTHWYLPNGKFRDDRGVESSWTIKGDIISCVYPDGGKSTFRVDATWGSMQGINGTTCNGTLRGTNLTNATPPPSVK